MTQLGPAELLGRDGGELAPGPPDRIWDLILLDRDGTLNRLRPGYVTDPEDLDVLPDVPEALAQLSRSGARFVVVTNQRGLARGMLTPAQLVAVHERLVDVVSAAGGRLDGFQVCGHEEGECNCRKPAPGLVEQALRRAPWARPERTVMVGDTVRDEVAARAAGVQFLRVADPAQGLPEVLGELMGIFSH